MEIARKLIAFAKPRHGDATSVAFFGQGGEFARSFFYHDADLGDGDDKASRFLENIAKAGRFVTEEAKEASRVEVERLFPVFDEAGLKGLSRLDYFYVFQRIRRLPGRARVFGSLWPLFSGSFVSGTLFRSPTWRSFTD